MFYTKFFFLFATLLLSSLCLSHEQPLPLALLEYQASYALYWHGIKVGKSTHQVKHLGNNLYQALSDSRPILPFLPFEDREESQFSIQGDMIVPNHYQFRKIEKGKTLQGEMRFEPKNKKT